MRNKEEAVSRVAKVAAKLAQFAMNKRNNKKRRIGMVEATRDATNASESIQLSRLLAGLFYANDASGPR